MRKKPDWTAFALLGLTVVFVMLAFKIGYLKGGIDTCEGSGGELIEYGDDLRCGNITVLYVDQEIDCLGRFKAQYVREGIP